MTFQQHIANFVTGNLTTSQLPQIGLVGLEQGLESESLTILAGMSDNDNPFELEDYFNRALSELGIKLPEKRQAAIELALYYADQIIENKVDPIDGVKQIIRNALGSYDFFHESKEFAMDSIGFSEIYGLYWSFDDLIEADRPWSNEKTNEELMKDIKVEIVEEVKQWRQKTAHNTVFK